MTLWGGWGRRLRRSVTKCHISSFLPRASRISELCVYFQLTILFIFHNKLNLFKYKHGNGGGGLGVPNVTRGRLGYKISKRKCHVIFEWPSRATTIRWKKRLFLFGTNWHVVRLHVVHINSNFLDFDKIVRQDCSTKMFDKNARQKCSTILFNKNTQQKCLTKLFDKIVRQNCSTEQHQQFFKCVKLAYQTRSSL